MMSRVGLFYCAAPLSGAFGGLLATGLAQISHHHYNGKGVTIRRGGENANYGPRMAVDFYG